MVGSYKAILQDYYMIAGGEQQVTMENNR